MKLEDAPWTITIISKKKQQFLNGSMLLVEFFMKKNYMFAETVGRVISWKFAWGMMACHVPLEAEGWSFAWSFPGNNLETMGKTYMKSTVFRLFLTIFGEKSRWLVWDRHLSEFWRVHSCGTAEWWQIYPSHLRKPPRGLRNPIEIP